MKSLAFSQITRAALLAAALTVFAAPQRAANWPEWRGPNHNLTTTETGFPVEWSREKNIRWRTELPDRGNSSPVVWGDRVFVTQAIEESGRRMVMCFDRADGELLWQKGTRHTSEETTHRENTHCAASPVTDGERVIASFGSAGVFCFDMEGREIWRRDLGPQKHVWGNASSPILFEDRCILYHGPGEFSALYALDKQTGATIWKVELPEPKPTKRTDGFAGGEPGIIGSFSTPLIVGEGDEAELIMTLPEEARAFDPRTGETLWRCEGLNPLIYTSPIYGEGLVVAMGGYFGGTLAVRPGGKGDVTASRRIWHVQRAKKNRIGSGIVKDGHVYVLNSDGMAECLNLNSGETVWMERLSGPGATSESWSSMVLTDGRLYVPNRSGDVHVIAASPEFKPIAVNSVGELSNSTLALSEGDIFFRTHDSLWCVSEQPRANAAF